MIKKMSYTNSAGETVEFGGTSSPWRYGVTDVFDLSQEYSTTANKITSFTPGIRELSLQVILLAGSVDERNRFASVIEYDTRALVPGTLRAGSSYMRCYVKSYALSSFQTDDSLAVYDLVLISDSPIWVRKHKIELTTQEVEAYGGLDYPHDYPHNYLNPASSSAELANPFALPCKCDIAFAGPCVNPYIIIAGNRYQVMDTAEKGQLIIVRGFGKKDVVRKDRSGSEISVFSKRVADSGAYIFEEVPPGKSIAAWSGTYPIEVTLYEEALTPWWT